MKRWSIYLNIAIAYVIFLLIAIFVEGKGINEFVKIILSVSSFLFAIILAFSTANRHKRLNAIRKILRNDDALLVGIYKSSKVLGKQIANKCKNKIDEYLVSQIDHELEDYEKSTPKFLELYQFILHLNASNDKEKSAKNQMLSDIRDSMQNQKEVIYWVKDRMLRYEWISLMILCGIMIFSLFFMNDNSLFGLITVPLLSTSLILLFLVLKELNDLAWQEQNWIWNPLIDLFNELDLPPYFTDEIIESKRINETYLKSLDKYRVATYPHPYPDLRGKKVKLVRNKK